MGHTLWDGRTQKNEKVGTIITALKQFIDADHSRRFKIHHILGDCQFKHTRKHIEKMGIILNITSQDEHVPGIEWYIRTLKQRVWVIVNKLPFNNTQTG